MDKKKEKHLESMIIHNKEGVKKFLKDLKYPVYFLDFEAITNSKQWMYENGLALDQQISSFSILRIDKEGDDETKVKHFNTIGRKEDYKLMAKSLTDFYKGEGSVVVWGQDLEYRSLGKLIKESPDGLNKKLSKMISNIIDLQTLFYSNSFISITNTHKTSLDVIAKSLGTYLTASIRDGRKAHFVLEHTLLESVNDSHLANIKKRIESYNNSDVINIKRILIKVLEEIK